MTTDQRFAHRVLKYVEKALNAYLHLDPEVTDGLAALSGKVVALIFLSAEGQVGLRCYCCITPVSIRLQSQMPETVDVTLQASLVNYLQLAIQQNTQTNDLRIQ